MGTMSVTCCGREAQHLVLVGSESNRLNAVENVAVCNGVLLACGYDHEKVIRDPGGSHKFRSHSIASPQMKTKCRSIEASFTCERACGSFLSRCQS